MIIFDKIEQTQVIVNNNASIIVIREVLSQVNDDKETRVELLSNLKGTNQRFAAVL